MAFEANFLDYQDYNIMSEQHENIFDILIENYDSQHFNRSVYDHQILPFPTEKFHEDFSEQMIFKPKEKRKLKKGKENKKNRPRKYRRKNSSDLEVNMGHWSNQENRKYHQFLEIHSAHFLQKHLRRVDKIFKVMATFVGTRKAEQCRSHHQKMQKKHHNFYRILERLRLDIHQSCDHVEVMKDLEANGHYDHGELITEQQIQEGKDKEQDMPNVGSLFFEKDEEGISLQNHINKKDPAHILSDEYEKTFTNLNAH